MLDGAPDDVLAGARSWRPSVSAWLGTTLLAAEVPVVAGGLRGDAGSQVLESLDITVPEWASTVEHRDGFSWVPDTPEHPLGKFGQHLDVSIVVASSVTGVEYETRRGRFLIQDWTHDGDTVQVKARGRLQVAADARLRVPVAPRAGETLGSLLRRLVPAGIPVLVDPALTDRVAPRSFLFEEDRLDALYDIADAWPARLRVDSAGTLRVLPPLSEVPVPVLSWADGEAGTVISAPRSDTRDQVYNVVVARSSKTDDPARAPVQAVAEVGAGPLAPATYGEVVRFWSSPLATTVGELQESADTILANSTRPANVRVVRHAGDPRVELDDPVQVSRDSDTVTGWVTAYDIPLIFDGEQTTTVGVA